MQFLFDSNGQHIANEVNGHLHAPTGQNIGHFKSGDKFFIDMQGYYLGEIVRSNRLMRPENAPSSCWGSLGNYGNIGNYGNPGNPGSIGSVGGYRDIDKAKLKV